jgi:type I site-specific restriction endonuclease
MTLEQRQQLEENGVEPEAVEYEQRQVDKCIFNKDTNRLILRNLMENGIKVDGGSRLGKTIIFARNHNHALLLQTLFDEMYPQYGGNFCRVIDYDDLPDVVEKWKLWNRGRAKKQFEDRTARAFFVSRDDIAAEGYDLSIGRYKKHVYTEAKHDPPKVILGRLKDLEKEIAADIRKLEGMLR